jgi:hypothetical protein
MIELQLDDTHRITSDKWNFILETSDVKSKQPTGEFKWKNPKYFGSNLGLALKQYIIDSVRDLEKAEVSMVLDKLIQLEKHIDRVVKRENIKIIVKDKDSDE